MYERTQVATLVERLSEPPRRIIAVFGPRQSGKTTIVDQALARIRHLRSTPTLYFAADEPSALRRAETETVSPPPRSAATPPSPEWIEGNWKRARQEAERNGDCVLVLDEVQNVPGWSTAVKGLWDADRGLPRRPHIVILGSASLVVQSGLRESLVGRFAPLPVGHWSLREMAAAFAFDLPQHLFYGGYPGVADLALGSDTDAWREAVLEGCVRPSIERDIVALTRVDKPALMRRLFEMSTHYSGQIVSFTKLLGHLQDAGNTTTLARYLDLLEAAGLVTGLSGYATAPLRRRPSPKLLVLNTALMAAPSGYDFREARADPSWWGRLVESAVGAHLFWTRRPATRLHYWRQSNFEVDFVLERGPYLLAVEVKSGAFRGPHAGLDAFRDRFPRARTMIVGEGGVPLVEFLSEPAERWLTEPWD